MDPQQPSDHTYCMHSRDGAVGAWSGQVRVHPATGDTVGGREGTARDETRNGRGPGADEGLDQEEPQDCQLSSG